MSLAILFHFFCTQHVSDINISIIRSLRLFCWITTLVVLFLVRCVLESNRKLLMMDILMSETCWAHKKWNTIVSDNKMVFYSSTITMMHGPINIKFTVFGKGLKRLPWVLWVRFLCLLPRLCLDTCRISVSKGATIWVILCENWYYVILCTQYSRIFSLAIRTLPLKIVLSLKVLWWP